jgi:uncharacterized protein (TIGR03118 family)
VRGFRCAAGIRQEGIHVASLKHITALAALAGAIAAGPTPGHAQITTITQTNLVSNLKGKALTLDPNLQNPWGIANFPGGPLWISDNNAGLTTLYTGAGAIVPLVVTVPPAPGQKAGTLGSPTGIVWNPIAGTGGFTFMQDGATVSALFIFDSEDGTIQAWAPGTSGTPPKTTTIVVNNAPKNAVYKGLAFGTNAVGAFIFATDFRLGTVEAYDTTFTLTKLTGTFADPMIPKGYAPFGIQNIDGDLFVTYAKQDAAKHDEVFGAGFGFVDVFSTEGVLLKRFASGGVLDAPWGVVRAPYGFGGFAGEILIGNFGNGWINSFPVTGGLSTGPLSNAGKALVIRGLWSLVTGSAADTNPDALYFTAGPNDETNGIFGSLTAKVAATTPPPTGGSGY